MSSFITDDDIDTPMPAVLIEALDRVDVLHVKARIFDALFGGGVDPICGLYWHTGMQQYRVGVQYPPTEGNTRPVPAEFNALIQKWEASK